MINAQTAAIDFTRYAAYIESVRDKLPAHIYSFASDPRYFDLSSHSSLHDAWLESLIIREAASGERHEIRRLEIALCFLGPFRDRRIHLNYTGVTHYTLTTPPRNGKRYENTGHGDLLTHEIRLGHHGLFVHEFLFERDATYPIEISDIRHSEEKIINRHETV